MDIDKLINNGVAIAVLVYILWKLEPRMKAISDAINRQSQLFLILIDEVEESRPRQRSAARRNVLDALRAEMTKEPTGKPVQ
jgi:collagenase-like PrtC family protease